MVRKSLFVTMLLARVAWPQQDQKAQNSKSSDKQAQTQEQAPPEEDESLKPKEYAFNPLEAEHDVKVGLFYFKKGDYKAAMNRFREATLWNPTLAEAFLRLGESEEKLNDKKGAKEAYAKYLELAPDAKDADAIKKKIGKR